MRKLFVAILATLGSIVLSSFSYLHEYKMSVCEVIQQPAAGNYEVKFYLYTDDLTEALTGNPTAPLPGRDQITAYILQHFSLQINGASQNLQFYSIRQKEDQVLVQFNTPAVSGNLSNIKVKNNLLTEKFSRQTNMVYAIIPGKNKKIEMMDAKKQEVVFSF